MQWGGEQGRWCVDSEVKGVRKLRDPELGLVALFRRHGSGSSGFSMGHLVLCEKL